MILAWRDSYIQMRLYKYLGSIFICLLLSLPGRGSPRDSLISLSHIREMVVSGSEGDLMGQKVAVAGIANVATGQLHERFLQVYIQNDLAGLSLFSDSFDQPVTPGDSLIAYGEVQQYLGLTEINVERYQVVSKKNKPIKPVRLQQVLGSPENYEGMLVSGPGVVRAKGNRYNGKYLTIAPSDTSRQSMMIYVSNFHNQYEKFEFDKLSIGDHVQITGILSRYQLDPPSGPVYKIFLRTPADLEFDGIPKFYLWLILLVVSGISVLVLGWILMLKDQVGKQTQLIKNSLKEKEILLQEIHHRVKNNLAIISGLIELQLDSTTDEAAQRVLKDSQVRIQSMAMVHEKLYESATLSSVGMDVYIRELVEAIQQTFADKHRHVEIEFRLETVQLDIQQVIPCGLLINELVVNAFKHAFHEGGDGRLTIIFGRKDGMVELTIADNGPGLPEDFSHNKMESLGLMLIHTFASQLSAEVEVEQDNGTSFSFRFPPTAE